MRDALLGSQIAEKGGLGSSGMGGGAHLGVKLPSLPPLGSPLLFMVLPSFPAFTLPSLSSAVAERRATAEKREKFKKGPKQERSSRGAIRAFLCIKSTGWKAVDDPRATVPFRPIHSSPVVWAAVRYPRAWVHS